MNVQNLILMLVKLNWPYKCWIITGHSCKSYAENFWLGLICFSYWFVTSCVDIGQIKAHVSETLLYVEVVNHTSTPSVPYLPFQNRKSPTVSCKKWTNKPSTSTEFYQRGNVFATQKRITACRQVQNGQDSLLYF